MERYIREYIMKQDRTKVLKYVEGLFEMIDELEKKCDKLEFKLKEYERGKEDV